MAYKKTLDEFSFPAAVLKSMIYANIFMFVVSLAYSGKEILFTANPLLFLTPATNALIYLGATGNLVIPHYNNWWSVLTANWLHGGLLHLIFNMLALRTLVPLVSLEFGFFRMFTLYTLTGMAGFILSIMGNVSLTVGASSGICGLIGAAFYFGKSRGGQWGQLVYKQTTGWVITLALLGFLVPNINNWSHAGGLVSGIFLGWLLGYNEKRIENFFDKALAAALAAITIWQLLRLVIKGFFSIYF